MLILLHTVTSCPCIQNAHSLPKGKIMHTNYKTRHPKSRHTHTYTQTKQEIYGEERKATEKTMDYKSKMYLARSFKKLLLIRWANHHLRNMITEIRIPTKNKYLFQNSQKKYKWFTKDGISTLGLPKLILQEICIINLITWSSGIIDVDFLTLNQIISSSRTRVYDVGECKKVYTAPLFGYDPWT